MTLGSASVAAAATAATALAAPGVVFFREAAGLSHVVAGDGEERGEFVAGTEAPQLASTPPNSAVVRLGRSSAGAAAAAGGVVALGTLSQVARGPAVFGGDEMLGDGGGAGAMDGVTAAGDPTGGEGATLAWLSTGGGGLLAPSVVLPCVGPSHSVSKCLLQSSMMT